MVTLVAKLLIKSGKVEDYLNLVEELIEETRKEKGCLSYNLYQDIHDNRILTFIEEWADEEAVELHVKSKHFTTIVPQLGVFQEGQTEKNLYKRIR